MGQRPVLMLLPTVYSESRMERQAELMLFLLDCRPNSKATLKVQRP